MSSKVIIIRRRARPARGAHHGGSWKVALADFAMAMMALFLVLWLVEVSSDEQKQSIAEYFSRPGLFEENNSRYPIDFSGSAPIPAPIETMLAEGESLQRDQTFSASVRTQPNILFTSLKQDMLDGGSLSGYHDNLRLTEDEEGIRIDIIENGMQTMFGRGGKSLDPYFEDLLLALAPQIADMGLSLKITGHTDGVPFGRKSGGSNWTLSYQRARAALETLVHGGFPEAQIEQVVAMADRHLLVPDEPKNPVNRRIELLLLTGKKDPELSPTKQSSMSEAKSRAKSEAAANQIWVAG